VGRGSADSELKEHDEATGVSRSRRLYVGVAIAMVAVLGLLAWNQWWRDPYPVGSSHRIAIDRSQDEICYQAAGIKLGDWSWPDPKTGWLWTGRDSVEGRLTIVSEHEARFEADDGQAVDFSGGRGTVLSGLTCYAR
jgi:hypothetical protein